MSLWIDLVKFYGDNFHIPAIVVEYMVVLDILRESVTGYSNSRISNKYDLSIQEVSEILNEFLGFAGWNFDLDFNPIALYNKSNSNFQADMTKAQSNYMMPNKVAV